MNTAKRIGYRIKVARERADLSRAELMELLGIDKTTCLCGQWERGVCSPSIRHLILLCNILKTTPNFLVPWRINCAECGHPVDVGEDGRDGCELSSGEWVCSHGCWDKATGSEDEGLYRLQHRTGIAR